MGIRVQCGIAQEQAQVQVKRIRIAAEDHAIDIHQYYAAEIIQIKPESAPQVLHGTAQGIITDQADQAGDNAAGGGRERIAYEPPHLALQDQRTVKAENIIKQVIVGKHGKEKHQAAAHHQI